MRPKVHRRRADEEDPLVVGVPEAIVDEGPVLETIVKPRGTLLVGASRQAAERAGLGEESG
jgi:hypothetical protein